MEVGTDIAVGACIEEARGFHLGQASVGSGERHEVQLELDAAVAQSVVLFVVHIHIAFGVREDELVPVGLQIVENALQVHGRRHVGGFDEEMPLVEGQEPFLPLAGESIIQHVLCRKAKVHRTRDTRLPFVEPFAEGSGRIAQLFHHMRGEVNAPRAEGIEPIDRPLRLVPRLYPIIHPRKQVGVQVGHAQEQVRLQDICFPAYAKHAIHALSPSLSRLSILAKIWMYLVQDR